VGKVRAGVCSVLRSAQTPAAGCTGGRRPMSAGGCGRSFRRRPISGDTCRGVCAADGEVVAPLTISIHVLFWEDEWRIGECWARGVPKSSGIE